MKYSSRTLLPFKLLGLIVTIFLSLAAVTPSAKRIKVGFLVHDLIADRWKKDIDHFTKKVETLGGETIVENGLGDAAKQVAQGKALIDQGIKVIVVVPQDAKVLGELVTYADKAGAKIIAYDRMILNCNLHYYISFNSITVGELMAEYALKLKPKGNFIILNGPSTDNNALLVRKGVMNKLKKHIDSGKIKIVLEKEMDSWYGLSSLLTMQEFMPTNNVPIDAIITGSDDLATGTIEALEGKNNSSLVVTGQDASVEACRNILAGKQSMTIYKSIEKLSNEAAIVAMKIANGEKIEFTTTLNNGKREVPSILFDPVIVDKSNLMNTVVADGHIREVDLH